MATPVATPVATPAVVAKARVFKFMMYGPGRLSGPVSFGSEDNFLLQAADLVVGVVFLEVLAKPVNAIVVVGVAVDRVDVAC